EALERIEDSARDAVDDLHGLIGTLREQEHPDGAGRAAPEEPVGSLGLERIPRLVADAADAGVPTSFRVIGEPTPLPPVLSLNLYRIAQEALTNVRKHAGAGAS